MEQILNLFLVMKKYPLIRFKSIHKLVTVSYSCIPIFGRHLILLSGLTVVLNSCGPASTNNYYNTPATHNSPSNNNDAISGGGGGGTGDGGGGQGVLCGDAKNTHIKNQLFVRDIFEAINNHGLQMKHISPVEDASIVSPEAIRTLVNSIRFYFGPASKNLEFTHETFWKKFIERISFIDADKQLIPSNDANSPIALPKECKLVQIAYWDESSGVADEGTLYISKDLWGKLDSINKIGLLAHEFFFKQARKSKYTNSDFTRYKIGQLLSTEGLAPVFNEWEPSTDSRVKEFLPKYKDGYKFCEGTSKEDSSARLQFYQYEGKDKQQHFVFPLLTSKIINANLLQPSHFSFVPSSNERLSSATDLLIYRSDIFESNVVPAYNLDTGPWVNWWYESTGLLTSYYKSTPQLLKVNWGHTGNPVAWQDNINTQKWPIKLALMDPTVSETTRKVREVKKRDDLLQAVHERIRSKLKVCQSFNAPVTVIANAMSTLNKEVSDAIQSENYPTSFPKWMDALKNLELYTNKQELPKGWIDSNNCVFTNDGLLTGELPYLLYTLKINGHSEEEVIKILGEDAYYPDSEAWSVDGNLLPLPKIIASQNSDSLTFDLKCRDYTTIFSSAIRSGKAAKDIALPNPRLQVTFNTKSKKYKLLSEKRNQIIFEALGDYIRTESFETVDVSNPPEQLLKCQTPKSFEGFPCEDYNYFLSELSRESKATLTRCNSTASNPKGNLYCAILHTETEKNNYVIHFSYGAGFLTKASTDDVPKILFVRLIPQSEHRDLDDNESSK